MAAASESNSAVTASFYLKRKIAPQNLVLRLRQREIGLHSKSNVCEFINQRKFYLTIVPNSTISNVEKPPCFLRKFSPNGRFLIAFSSHQAALEIYEYVGIAYANGILERCGALGLSSNFCDLTSGKEEILADLRRTLFHKLFRLRFTPRLSVENEQLNRECSLFSSDSRYVIVVASALTPDDNARFDDALRNNESLPIFQQSPLEDYWIFCVELASGVVTDTKTFKSDKIYPAHNQGLCLYERTFAVLSVQHQTVHLYNLTDEGILMELHNVGRFLYDDDDMRMNSWMTAAMTGRYDQRNISVQPVADPMFTSLKQSFMSCLYKRASSYVDEDERAYSLRNFFRYFDFFRRLRIWRMQILDEDNLLLRYATEEVVTYRTDSTQQNSFFAFYNLTSRRIFAVYENIDEDFLNLYENFADHFRYSTSNERFPCSISSSGQARKNHDRYKQTILNARYGGQTEAVKRIVAQLPFFSQSFSSSPYLDLELFSYDEKWLSSLERPKTCGDFPIRVYGRDSCLLKFEIVCGIRNHPPQSMLMNNNNNHRSLVAFIFHPYEPFAISVQRNNRDYVVNFHLRNEFDDSNDAL